MQVQVHSDDPVSCDEELIQRVEGVIEGALDRFDHHIVRVDAHLSDLDSGKPGDRDKSCRLEARIAGSAPVTACHEAATLTEAIHEAAGQLKRSVARHVRELERKSTGRTGDSETEGLLGAGAVGGGGGNPVR